MIGNIERHRECDGTVCGMTGIQGIAGRAETLGVGAELSAEELEERRQGYRDWLDGQLRGFRDFVRGELDRLPEEADGYRPTARWFYEEIADALPSVMDRTATPRDERRLAMAAYAVQLLILAEERVDMDGEELGISPSGDSTRGRLRAATGSDEVPFQHPWVFHVEHDAHGTPHVA